MFRETNREKQIDIFGNVSNILDNTSYNRYSDPDGWHNQFRKRITDNMDEHIFSVLYADTMGAPNASVSLLVGMMLLKEAFGWSDSQTFEEVRFNLLARSALGLININDPIPAESTYYLFRKRIYEYQKETQKDLLEEVFKRITKEQIAEFEINGHSIRMDSKLIGSNIAYYSRYEIVHQTLISFCREIKPGSFSGLSDNEKQRIKVLLEESPDKIVYKNTREEIKERMVKLGDLAYRLLSLIKEEDNSHYATLGLVFGEQYKVTGSPEKKIELRPKEEITADSVQSPHDPDSGYRKKNGEAVKGYSVNITETCDTGELKLITSIQVEKANTPDNDFLITAVEKTKEVLPDMIENMHTDGAYNSRVNQKYAKEEGINFYLNGLQGNKGRYILDLLDKYLEVTDTITGEVTRAVMINEGKWRIKAEKGYRYFTGKDIETAMLRKAVEETPSDKKKIRNNVEAAMYHLSCCLRNNKTRYRGVIKQKMWGTLRCLWINLTRIMKFRRDTPPMQGILSENTVNRHKPAGIFPFFTIISQKLSDIREIFPAFISLRFLKYTF